MHLQKKAERKLHLSCARAALQVEFAMCEGKQVRPKRSAACGLSFV